MQIYRIKGDRAVNGCESYAETTHGRLRYDLLSYHYKKLVQSNNISHYVDIGGGNGLLAERLMKVFPDLQVTFFDDDAGMVARAKELLKDFEDQGRVSISQCSVLDTEKMEYLIGQTNSKTLFGFNHVIEYVEDKQSALQNILAILREDALLGIMYLNNSCEALRKILFKDLVAGVTEQLEQKKVNMGHFGLAEAVDTEWLDDFMDRAELRLISRYGLRCLSDFKSPDFVSENYDAIFDLECHVGGKPDFMGFSRYRLNFYSYQYNG